MFRHIKEIIIDKHNTQQPPEDFCVIANEMDVVEKIYDINYRKFYISEQVIEDWLKELLFNWKEVKYTFNSPLEDKIPKFIKLFQEYKNEFIDWFKHLSPEIKDNLIANKDYSCLFQFLHLKDMDTFWLTWNKDPISWLQKENTQIPESIINDLFSMLEIKLPTSKEEKKTYMDCILGIGEFFQLTFHFNDEFYPKNLWQKLNQQWKENFRKEWMSRIRNNNIHSLIASSNRHPLFNNLCELAYDYYVEMPEKLTLEIKDIIKKGIDEERILILESLIPPEYPGKITFNNLINWAKQHVMYHNWDYLINKSRKKSDLMEKAIEFSDLLINEYKNLVVKPINLDEIPLNIGSYKYIQELRTKAPILFVIVDGLNWVEHKNLENLLTQNNFYLKNDTKALFSILPTLTQYSKKALVTGEYPANSDDVSNIKDAFKKYNDSNSFYSHSIPVMK